MIRIRIFLAALLVLLASLPARAQSEPEACRPGRVVGAGVASWYGAAFDGEKDARGHRFNHLGMTAASKTLPLNSFVEVTNRRTRRKIVVKITDRGPYAKGRVLDLSEEAAHQLGFARKGVARVTVRACGGAGQRARLERESSLPLESAALDMD